LCGVHKQNNLLPGTEHDGRDAPSAVKVISLNNCF